MSETVSNTLINSLALVFISGRCHEFTALLEGGATVKQSWRQEPEGNVQHSVSHPSQPNTADLNVLFALI